MNKMMKCRIKHYTTLSEAGSGHASRLSLGNNKGGPLECQPCILICGLKWAEAQCPWCIGPHYKRPRDLPPPLDLPPPRLPPPPLPPLPLLPLPLPLLLLAGLSSSKPTRPVLMCPPRPPPRLRPLSPLPRSPRPPRSPRSPRRGWKLISRCPPTLQIAAYANCKWQ